MRKVCFTAVAWLIACLAGCQPEAVTRSETADETFYVQNAGAAMRVSVKGNTASNTFMIVVHGGPGGSAYFYRTDAMKTIVESEFAVVYWDQRSAGASQGRAIGTLTLIQYADDLKKVIQTLTHRYGASARVFIMGHSWGGLLTSAFLR
ncbi:alpha/beta hydrolase [Spirosoma arcticum]